MHEDEVVAAYQVHARWAFLKGQKQRLLALLLRLKLSNRTTSLKNRTFENDAWQIHLLESAVKLLLEHLKLHKDNHLRVGFIGPNVLELLANCLHLGTKRGHLNASIALSLQNLQGRAQVGQAQGLPARGAVSVAPHPVLDAALTEEVATGGQRAVLRRSGLPARGALSAVARLQALSD